MSGEFASIILIIVVLLVISIVLKFVFKTVKMFFRLTIFGFVLAAGLIYIALQFI